MAAVGVVDYSFFKSVKVLKLFDIIDPLFQAPLKSMKELEVDYNDNILRKPSRFEKLWLLALYCGPMFRELGVVDAPSLLDFRVTHIFQRHSDQPLGFVCQAAVGFKYLCGLIVNKGHHGIATTDSRNTLALIRSAVFEIALKGVDMVVYLLR